MLINYSTIPVIICHIYYFRKAAESTNLIFDMWLPTVIIQAIQCMTILATCIPFLKPFMDSLDSGQMNAGDAWHTTKSGSNSRSRSGQGPGYASRTQQKSQGLSAIATMTSNASHRRQKYEMVDMERSKSKRAQHEVNASTATAKFEPRSPWDAQSFESQSVLVHQTWKVEVEEDDGSSSSRGPH